MRSAIILVLAVFYYSTSAALIENWKYSNPSECRLNPSFPKSPSTSPVCLGMSDSTSAYQSVVFSKQLPLLRFGIRAEGQNNSKVQGIFNVKIDNDIIFELSDFAEIQGPSWRIETIDVSKYADDTLHMISFDFQTSKNNMIVIDLVELVEQTIAKRRQYPSSFYEFYAGDSNGVNALFAASPYDGCEIMNMTAGVYTAIAATTITAKGSPWASRFRIRDYADPYSVLANIDMTEYSLIQVGTWGGYTVHETVWTLDWPWVVWTPGLYIGCVCIHTSGVDSGAYIYSTSGVNAVGGPIDTNRYWKNGVAMLYYTDYSLSIGVLDSVPPFTTGATTAEVTSAEMTTAEVTSAEMTTGEITSAEMTTGEITSAEMTTAEITSAEMTSGEITSAEITSGDVTTGQYINLYVKVTVSLAFSPSVMDITIFVYDISTVLNIPYWALSGVAVDMDASTATETVVHFFIGNVILPDGSELDAVATADQLKTLANNNSRSLRSTKLLGGMKFISHSNPGNTQTSGNRNLITLGIGFVFSALLVVVAVVTRRRQMRQSTNLL